MKYKDFIQKDERVVYMPCFEELGWWCDFENCIVKIGEYRPYYTNGDADPKPEDYNEYCYVEAYPESPKIDDYQFRLRDLHPIQKSDENISVIYDCEKWKLVGKVLSVDYSWNGNFLEEEWNENGYAVIENEKGEWKVVDEDDYEIERDISDLSEDDLKKLRGEISVGSIYLHHYTNSFGIDPDYLCTLCEDYWSYLCDEYGDENADENDTPENFAEYVAA